MNSVQIHFVSMREFYFILSLNFSLSEFIDIFPFFVLLRYMVSELEPSSMASNTQTGSSSQRELTLMEDPRSPFFLHHGETLGAILVTQPLTENNYPMWSRAMIMALDAKSKLGFVDGTINASMAITPLEKKAWSKCNSMISSWILNSVSPHLTANVIYRDTAFEV